jgi:hypothetical protein
MSEFPTSAEERDQALDTLGRMARTHLTGNLAPQDEADARRRFRAKIARQPLAESARRKVKISLGAGALAATVAAMVVGRPFWRRRADRRRA